MGILKDIDNNIGFTDTLKKGEFYKKNILSYFDMKNMLSYLMEENLYKNIEWHRDINNENLIVQITDSEIKGSDKGIRELIITSHGNFKINKQGNDIVMYFSIKY